MKKTKKNNKGFSLVELIVVVLIMAIIAVALAPQIMKWVGHSRTSTDAQTYDTLVENVQLALADEAVRKEVAGLTTDMKISISDSGVTGASGTQFTTKLSAVCPGYTSLKAKDTTNANLPYEITVKKDGTVERTKEPDTSNVK